MWLERLWHKHLGGKNIPWAHEVYEGDELRVLDWNNSYALTIRARLEPELIKSMTDAEVIAMWIERHNHERVEPRLEMVHGRVNADGTISVKLDWNDAFIRMLREQGFEANNEDELIRQYLAKITRRLEHEIDESDPGFEAAMSLPDPHEIEHMLKQLDPATIEMIEHSLRRRSS
jgi:hypothetical protein